MQVFQEKKYLKFRYFKMHKISFYWQILLKAP